MSPPPDVGTTGSLSVGIDVSSVERVRLLVERRPEFLSKYFSESEAEYCRGRPERLAARWAAKEAVRKLYGGLGWRIPLYSQIAVVRRPGGAPEILVEGSPVLGLSVSLTHDAGLGMAVALLDAAGRQSPRLWGTLPADLGMPDRSDSGHKGSFGTVVLVAGSPDFPGAAVLCALGALRGGAGKVKVLVAGAASQALPPEVIRVPVSGTGPTLGAAAIQEARSSLDSATAVVCGPGLGQGQSTRALLTELFRIAEQSEWSLVLDADALNACAGDRELLRLVPRGSVLTPHPLEAARLAAKPVAAIEADRQSAATGLARQLGVVLVLKGAHSVVAAPDGATWVDDHATAALATGGTGDVLAGLVGALIAQGMAPYGAARTGVFLHAEAGTRLAFLRGRAGVLASEVAEALVETQEAVRRAQGRWPGGQ
ncbi:MAG: NAD(P)H-hydrate dehydratase [Candidatus Dormibacteria bacterium]